MKSVTVTIWYIKKKKKKIAFTLFNFTSQLCDYYNLQPLHYNIFIAIYHCYTLAIIYVSEKVS